MPDTIWNDAGVTRQLAHANWMANTAVLMHLNERATGDPARDWLSSWAHRWFVGKRLSVLVLGCGEGWLERAIAAWPFVERIDAVDFAAEAVGRAAESARGIEKIHYGVVDLNRDELRADAYDVVVAHSVLHHVANLEHAFPQIERAMRRDATLVVSEYVGPNRFQFSDDVLAIINALFAALPEELRGPDPMRRRPGVDEMIANDPTEAVRSAELPAFLESHFDLLERKQVGGTVLQHLLYGIVDRFRFDVPRERSLLDMLCTIEGLLVDTGRVPCDFALYAARRRGSEVRRSNRPLPPRHEGASDVERDPLSPLGSMQLRGERRAGARLRRQHLRLLRLALLSQHATRANLFEESTFYSLRERWRARNADPWEWLLGRAPSDRAIRALLETAATLAPA